VEDLPVLSIILIASSLAMFIFSFPYLYASSRLIRALSFSVFHICGWGCR
jgi:hypothetical protein